MASAKTLDFPLMCETSSWMPVVVAVIHSFSKKKASGSLVVNNEFIPASAPVLSERLEMRIAKRCAGRCCVRSFNGNLCQSFITYNIALHVVVDFNVELIEIFWRESF